jgi:hypothetical protein
MLTLVAGLCYVGFSKSILSWCSETGASSVYYTQQVSPEDDDRMQSPKRFVLNKRQDDR